MKIRRWAKIFLLLACSGISVFWGLSLERSSPLGMLDLRGLYYPAQCLLQNCDPYNQRELQAFYLQHGGEPPSDFTTSRKMLVVTLFVNMPTTLLLMAPLALLQWGPAHIFWMILIAGSFLIAALLLWKLADRLSPGPSLLLVCMVLANGILVIASGNTAGIVTDLCVIAACCFIRKRFVLVGVAALAVSLVIKPHDTGFVWLYFLLAGEIYRKWALQTFAVAAALGAAALLWLSQAAPHWLPEMRHNIAVISGPGGLNEPGPFSLTGKGTAGTIIDLQSVLSVFWDNPRFYNPLTYAICGILLAVWSITTLRSRPVQEQTWLALAAIAPLTMLVTYHRPYDAKLLLLSVPACALLWAEGGVRAWMALLINAAGIVLTGDIPLAMLVVFTQNLHFTTEGLMGKLLTIVLNRPAPVILLVMAIFYLWVYVRSTRGTHLAHEGNTD